MLQQVGFPMERTPRGLARFPGLAGELRDVAYRLCDRLDRAARPRGRDPPPSSLRCGGAASAAPTGAGCPGRAPARGGHPVHHAPPRSPAMTVTVSDVLPDAVSGFRSTERGTIGGPMGRRRFSGALAGIVVFALAFRVGYVLIFAQYQNSKIYDSFWYGVTANELKMGQFFRGPLATTPSAAHPPLTSILAGTVNFIIGLHAGTTFQRLVMAVLGAGVVLCVGLLGRAVAGPWVGLTAAGLAAVAPNFWMPSGIVMSETPAMLFMALILLAVTRLLRSPTMVMAALLGAACGAEALVRAELLLFVPFLLVPAVLTAPGTTPRRKLGLRPSGSWPPLWSWPRGWDGTWPRSPTPPTSRPATACAARGQLRPDLSRPEPRVVEPELLHVGAGPGRRVGAVIPCPARRRAIRRAPRRTASDRGPGPGGPVVGLLRADPDGERGRQRGPAGAGVVRRPGLLLRPLAPGHRRHRHLPRRRIRQWFLLVPAGVVTVVAALVYGLVRFRSPFEVCLVVLAAPPLVLLGQGLGHRVEVRPVVAAGTPGRGSPAPGRPCRSGAPGVEKGHDTDAATFASDNYAGIHPTSWLPSPRPTSATPRPTAPTR